MQRFVVVQLISKLSPKLLSTVLVSTILCFTDKLFCTCRYLKLFFRISNLTSELIKSHVNTRILTSG